MNKKPIALLFITLTIWGCSKNQEGRYQIAQDLAPSQIPNIEQLESLQPRYEPYSAGGNRDYQVLGKNYQVLDSAEGYVKEGFASWYGAKFHGHQTSNGEIYDMFSLSAAHTRLPLPSFVKVTNLDNGKSIVVRVNDRGPFHSERIIDLSYAAAQKLDMLDKGTAPVKLEAYHFEPPTDANRQQSPFPLKYLQLAASKDPEHLQAQADTLPIDLAKLTKINQQGQLYKLQLGPIGSQTELKKWQQALKAAGWHDFFQVINK